MVFSNGDSYHQNCGKDLVRFCIPVMFHCSRFSSRNNTSAYILSRSEADPKIIPNLRLKKQIHLKPIGVKVEIAAITQAEQVF